MVDGDAKPSTSKPLTGVPELKTILGTKEEMSQDLSVGPEELENQLLNEDSSSQASPSPSPNGAVAQDGSPSSSNSSDDSATEDEEPMEQESPPSTRQLESVATDTSNNVAEKVNPNESIFIAHV